MRGADLNDLYASVKIAVGDSCYADRSTRYFSDRAFEAPGRGAFSLFPRIPALTDMLIEGEPGAPQRALVGRDVLAAHPRMDTKPLPRRDQDGVAAPPVGTRHLRGVNTDAPPAYVVSPYGTAADCKDKN